ncbi:MAG: polysaccharide deacetylase family protein [Intestinibacter bartlettii]|uniref:polysaccharide deacetylase family protein n=1 Tax=Intestinibacter bartlettii TaxID=261299 RepID=UPI0026EC9B65|nr:polysaccharide deacetylase family protein [Intestinibacter bartlettii]MDO5009188.1 polysaccharide deacetylase family protein [Intestinibacter bartlettii]
MFARVRAFLSSIILFLLGLVLIFSLVYCIKIFLNEQNADIPIYRVDTKKKEIALTFDISYNERNIDEILDVLDKYNVKATFFVVGNWVDKNQDVVKKIYDRGHEIGNHSYSHPYFNEISEEKMKEELESTSKKIKAITGEGTTLFRPPFGEINENGVKVCESLGYKVINWDVDSMDWKNIKDIYIIDRVAQNTSPGSIILFHGEGSNVEDYLDSIVKHFSKSGYSMIKVSDLVYDKDYYIDSSGVQRKK